MKTKTLLFMSALLLGGLKLSAQDLAPGINYSYNPPASDGIITNINVDVVENDGTSTGSFDVAMYLYDMATSTPYVIGTTTINSISGYGLVSITNWNIDINNTPGIPAGTYRLGVWVDSNNDITESDENNNAGLLAGNINYNPNASGIATSPIAIGAVSLFPNPANENATVNFTLTENSTVSLKVYDMTGNEVMIVSDKAQMATGDYSMQVETAGLSTGIYFMTLSTGDGSVTRRLTVTH
jgi:hypothetical protein